MVVLLRQPIRRPLGWPDRPFSTGRPRTRPGGFGVSPSAIEISLVHGRAASATAPLALRQVDRAPTDFVVIESDLSFMMYPHRCAADGRELARLALVIIFAAVAWDRRDRGFLALRSGMRLLSLIVVAIVGALAFSPCPLRRAMLARG
jgi:hypothetical protein